MRTIVFFDLPTFTSTDLKNYRRFIKLLKTNGFYMIQESVYVRMSIDEQAASTLTAKLKSNIPPEGNVFSLTITEKQFASMDILLGEIKSDLIVNNERILRL